MKIRTKSQYHGMAFNVESMISGERPHAYTGIVREGFWLHRRAFRCPGQKPEPADWWMTTEDRILREVKAIRSLLESRPDG